MTQKEQVAAWITAELGERCDEYSRNCLTCLTWGVFDQTEWPAAEKSATPLADEAVDAIIKKERAAVETSIVLCPHGMSLAENTCGPCSQGRLNKPAELGFGIAILASMVRARMKDGHSKDDAFNYICNYAELRSEAIQQLRTALSETSTTGDER